MTMGVMVQAKDELVSLSNDQASDLLFCLLTFPSNSRRFVYVCAHIAREKSTE